MRIYILLLAIVLVGFTTAKDISNTEINNAILSLVHSYNLLDNKLERHEHRERALGELVKRALQSLQKGQKAFEPINGIFSRLDDRVSQIETMLMTQEEKYNVQSDKLGEALEGIFKWMRENNACFNKRAADPQPKQSNDNAEMMDKMEKLIKTIEAFTEKHENLMKTKLTTATDIITKIEKKLSSPSASVDLEKQKEYEKKITNYFEEISTKVNQINDKSKVKENLLTDEDRNFFQGLSNDTLNAIQTTKSEILDASDKVSKIVSSSDITELGNDLKKSMDDILQKIEDATISADQFHNNVNNSFSSLNNGLEILNKVDNILLSTSDSILDTKRKVEFGTHQVLQKVAEIIHDENVLLNKTIQKRFDETHGMIANNHLEALQNFTQTIETEISHVWRQIEIMHGEISYSKNALNKLQSQTEAYVNGTFSTMENMENKVTQITMRMLEIDSNLNFLLGRLSLVTQEFNRIKSGLGDALDEIRNNFQAMQDKIKEVGPGPHLIPNNKYLTDINLLQKDAPASP